MTAETNKKKTLRNDLIFVGVLLSVLLFLGLALLLFRTEGDTVTVTVNGELYGEYSLMKNCTVEIRVGDAYNILVIEDGEAYVREASCPDGICAAHERIKWNRQSIICRPNQVVISISGHRDDAPDIIS